MLLTKATHTQQQAASPQANVWVSASAGSGKTKVLTDRVLNILLSGTPPERILCLTFTKAAAAEMANRIRERLGQWVILEDSDLEKQIEALTGKAPRPETLHFARSLFNRTLNAACGLKIQTVHGFCQSVLKRFPLEAGLSPHFQVLDEGDAARLLKDALDHSLQQDSDLAPLIERLSHLFNEDAFLDLTHVLLSDRTRLKCLVEEGFQAASLKRTLGVSSVSDEEVIRDFLPLLTDLSNEACLLMGGSKTDQVRGAALLQWQSTACDNIDEYVSHFLTEKGEVRARLMTAKLAQQNPEALDALEKQAELLKRMQMARKNAAIFRNSLLINEYGQAIYKAYSALKSRRDLLDYDDLIATTLTLLEKQGGASWVLYKLDGGLDHILIDEAQDTSPEQWRIIQAITEQFFEKDRSLFVVGDEKQSIYSFQGADPETFIQMQSYFAELSLKSQRPWKSLALDVSFRSTKEVLQIVDHVFEPPASLEGVSQHKIHHLAFREQAPGHVELWPLVVSDAHHKPEPWTPPVHYKSVAAGHTVLAQQISQTIKGWLDQKRVLPAKGRPVEPRDILILVRKRGPFVSELIRLLKEKNVPVAGVDRMRLLDQLAVQDMLKLAEFLLLPDDDLTLATVLKGPMIGLSEDHLFDLAHDRGDQSLWRRLQGLQDHPHYEDAVAQLRHVLGQVDFMTPHQLFSWILSVQGGMKKWISRLGEDAKEALEELLALTLRYEDKHTPTLQGFMEWIHKEDVELKRDLDQSQDVRIMTVHGSKGLQAPIVFLPDTTSVPTLREQVSPFDEGYVWMPASAGDTDFSQSLKADVKKKALEEYRRLFYVAMTRAEDELYISGYSSKDDVPESSWYALAEQALKPVAANDADRLVFSRSEGVGVVTFPQVQEAEKQSLPTWMMSKPEREAPIKKGPSPSAVEYESIEPLGDYLSPRRDFSAIQRGVWIHKLLELLPQLPREQHTGATERFLGEKGVPPSDIQRIAKDIEVLWRDYPWIFDHGSRAEVPVFGMVNGALIQGQIDRLIVQDQQITIIDYKTSVRPPESMAEIPQVYLNQMKAYGKILSKVYPKHEIVYGLLWTTIPRLDILLVSLDDL